MDTPFPLNNLKLAAIDFDDLIFVASYGYDLSRLLASIQALGLLNPPMLRRRPDGAHQIICGFQRLLVLKALDRTKTPALIAPAETPAAWCLQAALYDNALGRGFNAMEAAFMADRLLRYFDFDQVCQKYLPVLGLSASPSHLHKMLSLLTLEEPWQKLAAGSRLTVETAFRLSPWSVQDRQALLPWFQGLQLSHSRQLELVEFLTILSRRDESRPAAWLIRPELKVLLNDPILPGPEKISRLRDILRQWCFPRVSRAQEQFQLHLKALGLLQHPEIRLTPPPAFEDADFRLELRFRDRRQLHRQLQQVAELFDKPDFEALLQL